MRTQPKDICWAGAMATASINKNGINLWKTLRKESGLSKFKPNVLRHTAISFFYRHNPFTNQETLEESLMDKQFGNGEDVRDRHYKNVAKMTIADAKRFWEC